MNRYFVPASGRADQNANESVAVLKRMGASRVFLSIGERFPFERGPRREAVLAAVREKMDVYRAAGIEPALWMDTLGFGVPHTTYNQEAAKAFTPLRSLSGRVAKDAFCPADPAFRGMICDLVADIARAGIGTLMLDDELCQSVRPGIGCACPRHLALYRERLGEDVDPAALPRLAFSGAPSRYRSVWLDLMGDTLRDFCRAVREAADRVDPSMRIGLCAGYTSWDFEGADALELATILAGKNRPFLRLSGAPYWYADRRFGRQTLQSIVEFSRMQEAWSAGSGVEIFTEADTYPRDRFHTPAVYSECFDLATRAASGIDALKYVFDYVCPPAQEPGYAAAHIANADLRRAIDEAFAGLPAVGVRVYEPMRRLKDAVLPPAPAVFDNAHEKRLMKNASFSSAERLLSSHAIPTVYEGPGVCGVAFGQNAAALPEEALAGGMILDCAAAAVLQARGVDVGLLSREPVPNAYVEEFGGDPATRSPLAGAPEVCRVTLSPRAEVLSEYVPAEQFSEERLPASYFYENADGQKFLVFAFDGDRAPDGCGLLGSYQRGRLIANAIPRLCGRPLPARCEGHPHLYCLARSDGDRLALAYFNCHADPICEANVVFPAPVRDVRLFGCSGKATGPTSAAVRNVPAFGSFFLTARLK